jgi:galactose mutarotase-like enzyme
LITLDKPGSAVTPISLENGVLHVVVLPEVGGMIEQVVHKPTGRDLLYHHPRLKPRRAYYRAPVDDWWAGGVIEGLPTCFACNVDGESLPDFGEVWSEPWTVIDRSPSSATVSCATRIWPLRITRSMALDDGAAVLRLHYRIENLGDTAIPFLWGLHPTVPVGKRTKIQIPARIEHVAGVGGSPDVAHESVFARGPVAFADIATRGQRFSYLTDLPDDAWYAVWDHDWPVAMGMRFRAAEFPCVGMWLLDGWRGLRAITLEPWIGWPGSLEEAIRLGRARTLEGHGRFEAELSMIAFMPVGPIRGFDPGGRPIPA